jgi:LacI family transcriptional regulator
VLTALGQLGVRIPSDIAFAGFDDLDMAEFTAPPLTVVRQPAQEMGKVATNLLFDRIARGELPQTGNKIVLPVEIVLRRSCGCKNRIAVIMH